MTGRSKADDAASVLEAAAAASDKKATDIVILDVSKPLVITDHFLICSGNNERQVATIAEEIERRLIQREQRKPARREGDREARWIVLDYIDFVVHVFHTEDRKYYELERLWSDAPVVPFEDESWEGSNEPAPAKASSAS